MKSLILAVALAFMAASAQAAVVTTDFAVGITSAGGAIGYTGASLGESSAFSFDAAKLDVQMVGPDDTTGQFLGNVVSFMPSVITYGASMSGPATLFEPVVKSWTIDGDVFSEKLTLASFIDRGDNSISVSLRGELTDTGGLFGAGASALMLMSATQTGGPGAAISVSLTDFAQTASTREPVPEMSTWVMMTLGFGLMILVGLRARRARGL